MPTGTINGIRMYYDKTGQGDPVVLVMGSGARGRVWHLHQVPALVAAGYSVVTFDNRGVPPTEIPTGQWSIEDMVADTAALIEHLALGPCRVAGFSLGAYVVQELLLARPDLVRQAVLMATRARMDAFHLAMTGTEIELARQGVPLPPAYAAGIDVLQYLSPHTIRDEVQVLGWLENFQVARRDPRTLVPQLTIEERMPDRRRALHAVDRPCLVIGFEHDVISPAYLGREVADAIPGGEYVEQARCGHLGYLESPEEVNKLMIEFFREGTVHSVPMA